MLNDNSNSKLFFNMDAKKYVIFNKCVVLCIKVLFCLVYKVNLQVNEALSVLVTYAILITSICTDTSSLVIN